MIEKISPMLAYASKPFDSPRHIYEIKWDGTRCILFIEGKTIRLQNRRLVDITSRYPELAGIHRALSAKSAVLDGELVVLSCGKPDFGKLQQREQITDPFKIRMLSRELPATFIVFDLMYLDGRWRTGLPLMERKRLLEKVLRDSAYLVESQYVRERGITFFAEALKLGFEGVMAKAAESPYLVGKRSRHWLKIKPRHSEVCYIIGYTRGKGARAAAFGALALATREHGGWQYRGRVGSGFSAEEAETLSRRLRGMETDSPPCDAMRSIRGMQWVRPELRCEVVFQERTGKGHFRAPVFKRIVEQGDDPAGAGAIRKARR